MKKNALKEFKRLQLNYENKRLVRQMIDRFTKILANNVMSGTLVQCFNHLSVSCEVNVLRNYFSKGMPFVLKANAYHTYCRNKCFTETLFMLTQVIFSVRPFISFSIESLFFLHQITY